MLHTLFRRDAKLTTCIKCALRFLVISWIALIAGCSKRGDEVQFVPSGFINLLKHAGTNDDIFMLVKTMPLMLEDTTFVGDLTYMNVTTDGRLAILDRANHIPLVFDSTGRFLGKIGKIGTGPGEFEHASAICYDDSNQIWWVADNTLLKISTFKNSGEYLRDFKVAANIQGLYSSNNGSVLYFMPNKRSGGLEECVKANGERVTSFFSSDIIKKLPFALYGGGLCLTRTGVFASHYLSSELNCFDYRGNLKFKTSFIGLTDYLPPQLDKNKVQNPMEFLTSFTGIVSILRGPFEVIIVQYRRIVKKTSGRGEVENPLNYLAFISSNGEVLASGIKTSIGYWASDERGNLYSVGYPDASPNQHENPLINKWTIRNF